MQMSSNREKMNEFEDHTLIDNTETQADKAEAETNHVETGIDSAQQEQVTLHQIPKAMITGRN